jgi:tetratricopeptide (TPR) repeat protein
MPKSSQHKGAPAAPQAGQLAAVRRLAESGDLVQARRRHAALREAYPEFKPLRALAWEIESLAGDPIIAAARAWDWQQASPNSRQAVEALCDSARDAGLQAVLVRAMQRALSRDEGGPAPSIIESIDTPLGVLTLEHAEAIDLARMHLADDNPGAAAAVLRGVNHPSARNNLALALFGSGDVQGAREVAEAAWQADPGNLFGLERFLRWRCWSEGLDRCVGFAATLSAAVPRRAEDANARVAALRFLGDAEAAHAAWEEVRGQDYWGHAAPEQVELFEQLGEPGGEVVGEHSLWFPRPWMKLMSRLARESKTTSEAIAQARWDAELDHCDAHADYLRCACEQGDAAIRLLASAVLKRRAKLGDPDARKALTALLLSLGGADSDRTALLGWLGDQGLRDKTEPAQVRLAGSVRTVRAFGAHITAQPRPSPYSAAGTALAERVHEALARRALDEAHSLARQLRALHPEQASTLTNLASIRQALGGPPDEVMHLYEQAHAMDPDHLFARCGLARCRVEAGRLDDARALFEGVFEREEWHYSEYRSVLLAQRALALTQGEYEAVRALEGSLRSIELEFGV